eukprot:3338939-Alexandrium_andersonii.AAC.1
MARRASAARVRLLQLRCEADSFTQHIGIEPLDIFLSAGPAGSWPALGCATAVRPGPAPAAQRLRLPRLLRA